MSLKYILTFDYELFGSGKGCVIKHLINPTNAILKELDVLGVKATFFVEQLEVDSIISLKHSFAIGTKEYNNAVLLEEQILDIVKRGHDVQLHLHPQWFNAKYKGGQWELNFNWWRFSALPYRTSVDGIPGKYDLLKSGKSSLEKLVRQVKPEYECTAFRAGGYNIGEDKTTIDALVKTGFLVDSSICPGFYSDSVLSQYDYTGVSSKLDFWKSSDSLYRPGEGSKHIVELPLITIRSSILSKISIARIVNVIKNHAYKAISYTGNINTGFIPRAKTFPKKTTNSNFDVCLSSRLQIKAFNLKLNQSLKKKQSFVVLIGHPKDYSRFSPMRKILKEISISSSSSFISLNNSLDSNMFQSTLQKTGS